MSIDEIEELTPREREACLASLKLQRREHGSYWAEWFSRYTSLNVDPKHIVSRKISAYMRSDLQREPEQAATDYKQYREGVMFPHLADMREEAEELKEESFELGQQIDFYNITEEMEEQFRERQEEIEVRLSVIYAALGV